MDVRHAAYVGSTFGGSNWSRWMGEARQAWSAVCPTHDQDATKWVEGGWRWTTPETAHVTLIYDLHGRDHSSARVTMDCARMGPLPSLNIVRTHWWTEEANAPAVWVAELDTAPWKPWIDELHRIGWRHHRASWTPHITLGKADSHTPAAARARALRASLNGNDLLPEWSGRTMGPWEPMSTHLRRAPRHR